MYNCLNISKVCNNKFISPNSLKKSILINFSISVLFAKLLVNISHNTKAKQLKRPSFNAYKLLPQFSPIPFIEPIPLYIILFSASQVYSLVECLNTGYSILMLKYLHSLVKRSDLVPSSL